MGAVSDIVDQLQVDCHLLHASYCPTALPASSVHTVLSLQCSGVEKAWIQRSLQVANLIPYAAY